MGTREGKQRTALVRNCSSTPARTRERALREESSASFVWQTRSREAGCLGIEAAGQQVKAQAGNGDSLCRRAKRPGCSERKPTCSVDMSEAL